MSAKYTVTAVSEAQNQSQSLFRYLAPELILPNPKQPRRSIESEALATLKESIRERGILQPLLVMRGEQGRYILVAGQRRLAAARELGLVRVPVMMLNEERPDYLVDSLIENIQREELSGIDEGHSFIALKEEFGWSQREIASRIHKHESYVSERIRTAERLTATTKEIISEAFAVNENLARAKFSHSINRKLALLPDQEQEDLARFVAITTNITARQVEKMVRDKLGQTKDLFALEPDLVQVDKTGDLSPAAKSKKLKKEKSAAEQLSMAVVLPGEGFETIQPVKPPVQPKPLKAQLATLKLELDLDGVNESQLTNTLALLTSKLNSQKRISLTELLEVLKEDYAHLNLSD